MQASSHGQLEPEWLPQSSPPIASIPTLSHPAMLQEERETSLEADLGKRERKCKPRSQREAVVLLSSPIRSLCSFCSLVPASSHVLLLFIHSSHPPMSLNSHFFLRSPSGALCPGPRGSLVGSASASVDDCMCMGLRCAGLALNKYLMAHLQSSLKQGCVYLKK